MLRGGEEILEHCEQRLGIGHKQNDTDAVFSLEEVECIRRIAVGPRSGRLTMIFTKI